MYWRAGFTHKSFLKVYVFLQVCVCVLKLSHPAVILKVSSAFSSLPGELFSSVLPSLRWVTWVVTLPVYGRPSAAPWPSQHRPRQWWQEALGWGVCFLPPALATCCQARAVGCFSSSVIRGDHPPPPPLRCTCNQKFHLERGLHRLCSMSAPMLQASWAELFLSSWKGVTTGIFVLD